MLYVQYTVCGVSLWTTYSSGDQHQSIKIALVQSIGTAVHPALYWLLMPINECGYALYYLELQMETFHINVYISVLNPSPLSIRSKVLHKGKWLYSQLSNTLCLRPNTQIAAEVSAHLSASSMLLLPMCTCKSRMDSLHT